jgi:hypothetical protein
MAYYSAVWGWMRSSGWRFIGYVPDATRAGQVVRALNSFRPYVSNSGEREWYYVYQSKAVVSSSWWSPTWFRIMVLGHPASTYVAAPWWDYGWFGWPTAQRVGFALKDLFGDSVWKVKVKNSLSYGDLVEYAMSEPIDDAPARVA